MVRYVNSTFTKYTLRPCDKFAEVHFVMIIQLAAILQINLSVSTRVFPLHMHCISTQIVFPLLSREDNGTGGRFKNTYELLSLRAPKISKLYKNHIFQCMGKIFCVEFQRVPLKFHTKYLTHTLKDVDFIHIWKFKSS